MQDEFPRLSVTRRVRDDGARYLGPFTDVKNLRRALRDLRRIFPLRTCRNFEDYRRQDRPCLYFHIRRCAGPCYSRARASTRPAYRAMADGLVLLLSGRNDELLERLRAEMAAAAEARRYEVAAQRRDQIRAARARPGAAEDGERPIRATPTCSASPATASAPRSSRCSCAAGA